MGIGNMGILLVSGFVFIISAGVAAVGKLLPESGLVAVVAAIVFVATLQQERRRL